MWDRTSTSVQGRVQNQIIITLNTGYYHDHHLSLKLAHPLDLANYNDKKLWDRTSISVQGRVQHQNIITLKICYSDHDLYLKLVHPLQSIMLKFWVTVLVLLFKPECNIKSSSCWKFVTMIMIYVWIWHIC